MRAAAMEPKTHERWSSHFTGQVYQLEAYRKRKSLRGFQEVSLPGLELCSSFRNMWRGGAFATKSGRATMLQVLRSERPVPMTMVSPVQVEQPPQAIEELPLQQPALPVDLAYEIFNQEFRRVPERTPFEAKCLSSIEPTVNKK